MTEPESELVPPPIEPNAEVESGGADPLAKARREAAGYRKRLRDAESRLEDVAARLTAAQRADAERLATGPGRLHDGADVWRAVDLDSLLSEEGLVDPTKVIDAVARLREASPHLAQAERMPGKPTEMLRSGSDPTISDSPTWGSVLAR